MSAELVASILQGVFLLAALVIRTAVHFLRTGTAGIRLQVRASLIQRLSVLAMVAGAALSLVAAPVQAQSGVSGLLESGVTEYLGLAVSVSGIALVLVAQEHMRDSWRVGVDMSETTALVATGPFRYVRNPIFSGMLAFWAGIALIVPNVLAIGGFLVALAGIEGQVRFVEEPYLLRTHGDEYRRYAARTGRLVPWLGAMR